MHSHHSHSGQFCAHAKDDLADILAHARSLGFSHFHLTEHCPRQHARDLYPEEKEAKLTPQDLSKRFLTYLAHARSLQQLHSCSEFQVLVGCETENLNGAREGEPTDSLTFLISQLECLHSRDLADVEPASVGLDTVDFLVGSVHHVAGVPIDFDHETFRRARELYAEGEERAAAESIAYAKLVIEYLERQYEVMQRLRPEVIGHMDLFRLYEPDFRLRPDSAHKSPADEWLDKAWSLMTRNVRYATAYGALFEANSAALRKGWKTSYPGAEILELILECGGRICLSDDSHGISYVALNYPRMREYLLSADVQDIWVLERDTNGKLLDEERADASEEAVQARATGKQRIQGAPMRFARGTRAVPVGRETWKDHPFWSGPGVRNS